MFVKLSFISIFSLVASTAFSNGINCLSIYENKNSAFPHESTSAVGSLGVAWMRDSDSPRTKAWDETENSRALDILTKNADGSPSGLFQKISDRTKERAAKNLPAVVETSYGAIFIKAGALVLKKKDGKEPVVIQPVVEHNASEKSVVPEFKVSPNGDLIAYSLVRNGSDVNEWYVYDLLTGSVKAGPYEVRLGDFNWSSTSGSVFFTRWPSVAESNAGANYAHNYIVDLKTKKENILFVPPAKDSREFFGMDSFIGHDGIEYFVANRVQGPAEIPLSIHIGSRGMADKTKGEFQVGFYKWKTLMPSVSTNLGKMLGIRNSQIYIRSAKNANHFEILALDPVTNVSRIVVKEDPAAVLLVSQIIGNVIYSQYLRTGSYTSFITMHSLEGNLIKEFSLKELGLTETGTLSGFVGAGVSENVYLNYQDIVIPTETLVIDVKKAEIKKLPSDPVNFDTGKIANSFVNVKSKDGTLVPLKIYSRTDQKKPKFVYLYYYGFIGTAQLPQWNKKFQAMIDLGGAVAIVSPRGGGDNGRDWQLAPKIDRFLTMEDVVAGSDHLRELYPDTKIIASGRSFGGMLTAMLMIFFPEKFDGYSIVVPVTDVNEFLNRQLFGKMAGDDFGILRDANGSVVDLTAYRRLLNRWNPLYNLYRLKSDQVKPVLVSNGGWDDRVGPEEGRFLVEAMLKQFPEHRDLIYRYQDLFTGHLGRTEQDREAMFVALVAGIQEADYSPLVNQPKP